jgi:hypothetical protein
MTDKALHRTAIPPRSIPAGEIRFDLNPPPLVGESGEVLPIRGENHLFVFVVIKFVTSWFYVAFCSFSFA